MPVQSTLEIPAVAPMTNGVLSLKPWQIAQKCSDHIDTVTLGGPANEAGLGQEDTKTQIKDLSFYE